MGTGTGSIDLSTLNNLHGDLTQHFWFNSNTGVAYGTGVHITLSSQAEFIANPTGQNILMNTDGISIRNGTIPLMVLDNDSLDFNVITDLTQGTYSNVATFGANGFRIGIIKDGETRLVANGSGIDLIRRVDGDNQNPDVALAHFGYDVGIAESGTAVAPYYTFGIRQPELDVGNFSFAEGSYITASGYVSHAEGGNTTASGYISHAEGYSTTASGYVSHAEGYRTTASGIYSHAEGEHTEASGLYSHAEGEYTEASGLCSHAEGYRTTASGSYSHVEGKYNVEDTANTYAHIIGNGKVVDGSIQYSNALTVDWDGTIRTDKNSMKTLWSGAWFMDASQTATLSEKVSEQLTGIVLVWSYYTGGAAQNYGWHTTFIPKAMVQLHNGVGWDIELRRTKNATFGTKYVYVNDDRIVGHADNIATGTANNVPYKNNQWVLRYVFGC